MADTKILVEDLAKLRLSEPDLTVPQLAEKAGLSKEKCKKMLRDARAKGLLPEIEDSTTERAGASGSGNSASQQGQAKSQLHAGLMVLISGLEGRPELNGQRGLVGPLNTEKARW